MKHEEPTSHAGHAHGADPVHHADAQAGQACCCSSTSAQDPTEPPSLAAASAAGGCCDSMSAAPGPSDSSALKDPVCGMTVTAQSPHVLEHEGKPVYFCSAGCKAKFAADPAQVPARRHAEAGARSRSPRGTIYTCPMHPEIRQDHPGACPKCGMALEPEMPSLEEGESPELVDFRQALLVDVAADRSSVAILAMLGHRFQWFGHGHAELGRARAVGADRPLGRLALLRPRASSRCATAARTCGR